MVSILNGIRADLQANADEKTKQTAQHFFKEQIKVYGIKTAIVGKVAKKYWLQVRLLGKQDIFGLCEDLLRSGYMEEAFVVSNWLSKYIDKLEAIDITTFKRWIENYVDNWAKCDSFCNHTVGDLIQKCPEIVSEVKSWAKSQNRWLKRAAAVSFIVPAKRGKFLKDAFEICDALLLDGDDLVQKGYGWLLKEESRVHQKEVFDYVVKHQKVMPRTALRYAIELMPKELKAEAMKKE
ncbi:MAG: DNA alkylation repair protein [Candidatus Bathyarchaeota archaeon]|nr:DNA alkylation repair protein [Candidatus Bathyarchaeota archaeon]